MPELPEVETIKKGLEKYVVGKIIKDIDIIHPGIFQGDAKKVIGYKVISIRRVGKGLIIDLDNKFSLAIHIKLTGQLIYRGSETEKVEVSKTKVGTVPNKFTHIIFHLARHSGEATTSIESKKDPIASLQDDKAKLYYNDQRRFGWIKVVKTNEVMDLPFFKNMGPEPFADLTLELFEKIIKGKTTKIKPLIMDQTKIGGIGNIYANDALFKAGIDPKRPAKSLSQKEIKDLYDSIISVMEKSFKEGGASELTFVNVLGQEGNYQRYSLVYGKTGKPCPRRDGGMIKRLTLAGRGTFFCELCQV